MKKIMRLGAISLFTTFLLIACSTLAPSGESHSGTIHKQNMTMEKIHDTIKIACEQKAWNVTEFKANTILVEKFDGASTKSVTIKFDKHSFDISPANSELNDAITAALGK